LQTRERWVDNYYIMRDHILGAMPRPARVLVGLLVYRNTVATLHGQGTGRFGADEMRALRLEIWESVNALLEEAEAAAAAPRVVSKRAVLDFGGRGAVGSGYGVVWLCVFGLALRCVSACSSLDYIPYFFGVGFVVINCWAEHLSHGRL
jgi:hypothetical protein